MKLDKTNVCVYIENESQLKEARGLLEKYGEEIYASLFELGHHGQNLKFHRWWYIGEQLDFETLITLPELEQILKS